MLTLWGFEFKQMSLPGFGIDNRIAQLPRKALGVLGEITVWRALEASGYVVRPAVTHGGDLRVIDQHGEIINVEVKTARPDKRGVYQFCLSRRLPDRVATDYRHSQVVVLLPVFEGAHVMPFVVPVVSLRTDLKQLQISSDPRKYAGKLATWRQEDLPLRVVTV